MSVGNNIFFISNLGLWIQYNPTNVIKFLIFTKERPHGKRPLTAMLSLGEQQINDGCHIRNRDIMILVDIGSSGVD